ncbi:Aldo/keto reductase family [Streptococcus merionis]|uniref:Aldo/keto reductase family n=1 Tax=Streptococcus merionis TaxID=400065 RepID=A0A239SMM0_9STRE|nr:Aldo/keto reductase family [Streptococcus merionis]
MRTLSNKYDVSPAQIATAWAIKRETTPILGVTKVEQVLDAAKAIRVTLTDADMEKLESAALATGVDTRGGWEGNA